jgi:hypothetical protein
MKELDQARQQVEEQNASGPSPRRSTRSSATSKSAGAAEAQVPKAEEARPRRPRAGAALLTLGVK